MPSPLDDVQAILRHLHPRCFADDDIRPMKVGIHDDILAAHPALDADAVGDALGIRTSTETYRRAVLVGRMRVGLAGMDTGRPLGWHKRLAAQALGLPPIPAAVRRRRRAAHLLMRSPLGWNLGALDRGFILGLLLDHPGGQAQGRGSRRGPDRDQGEGLADVRRGPGGRID